VLLLEVTQGPRLSATSSEQSVHARAPTPPSSSGRTGKARRTSWRACYLLSACAPWRAQARGAVCASGSERSALVRREVRFAFRCARSGGSKNLGARARQRRVDGKAGARRTSSFGGLGHRRRSRPMTSRRQRGRGAGAASSTGPVAEPPTPPILGRRPRLPSGRSDRATKNSSEQGADPALLASFRRTARPAGSQDADRDRGGDLEENPSQALRAPLRRFRRAVSLLCSRLTFAAGRDSGRPGRGLRRVAGDAPSRGGFAGALPRDRESAGTPGRAPMRKRPWLSLGRKGPARLSTRTRGSRGQWYWRSKIGEIEEPSAARRGRPPSCCSNVSSELDPERNAG